PIGLTLETLANASGAASCGTTPEDCLRPTTPLQAAGMRVEPPASVPIPMGQTPAASAAAAPPEEPPLVRSAAQALRGRPNRADSVQGMCPNSGVVVLPIRIAPARFRRATATASSFGTLCSKM